MMSHIIKESSLSTLHENQTQSQGKEVGQHNLDLWGYQYNVYKRHHKNK